MLLLFANYETTLRTDFIRMAITQPRPQGAFREKRPGDEVGNYSKRYDTNPHGVIDFVNPLSPKSDQHELSPYNISAYENRVVMRIEYMNQGR